MPRKRLQTGGAGANPNRTDLNSGRSTQAVATPTGLPYGEAGQLKAQQQVVPLPNVQNPQAPAGPTPGGAGPAAAASVMQQALEAAKAHAGQFGGLSGPSQRPNEPVTAGLPIGAGPGPEAVVQPPGAPTGDSLGATLRGIYARYPNEDLRALIAEQDQGLK